LISGYYQGSSDKVIEEINYDFSCWISYVASTGIPTDQWPIIMPRVVENKESLRTVAQEYGVSHETIRRNMLHFQMQRGQQEA